MVIGGPDLLAPRGPVLLARRHSNLVVTEITNHENGFDQKGALKMIGNIRTLWKQMMPRERNAIVKQVFDKINIAPEQITLCIKNTK